ncbi:MAG TPA: galactose oxidase-like domain-containing protein [Planctomycetota bacterium]|nr:galactose oxidase-like domain-containing protein [Planctomycetota bacterium]
MPGLQPYSEIAHVALIPNGPAGPNDKVGSVLFWRAAGNRPQDTYIWRPGPGNSVYVHPLPPPPPSCCSAMTSGAGLGGNVLCSGHSWSGVGRLVCAGADAFTCTPPATANVAQPGYWMLFAVLVTGAPSVSNPMLGIPSVAAFVRLQ